MVNDGTNGQIVPNDNDVLSGRGGLSNHHPGNKIFRQMVEDHKERYRCSTMPEKSSIARKIMEMVRNQDPPGRFLGRTEKTKAWFELDPFKAEKKTKQALRENKETPMNDTEPPPKPKFEFGDPALGDPALIQKIEENISIVASSANGGAMVVQDALQFTPPNLIFGEVQQAPSYMVEAITIDDAEDSNTGPKQGSLTRDHTFGSSRIKAGESLEVGDHFPWSEPVTDMGSPHISPNASRKPIDPPPPPPPDDSSDEGEGSGFTPLPWKDDSGQKRFVHEEPSLIQEATNDVAATMKMVISQQPGDEASNAYVIDPAVAGQWASQSISGLVSQQPQPMSMPMVGDENPSFKNDATMGEEKEDFGEVAKNLLWAPISSPYMSNSWSAGDGARKRFNQFQSGNDSMPSRPQALAKRATSFQNETEETKPDLQRQFGSVKRPALNRDNSTASNRLKAMFPPGGVVANKSANGAQDTSVESAHSVGGNGMITPSPGMIGPNGDQTDDDEMNLLSASLRQSNLDGQGNGVDNDPNEGMDPLSISSSSSEEFEDTEFSATAALELLRAGQSPLSPLGSPSPKSRKLGKGERVNVDPLLGSVEEEIGDEGDKKGNYGFGTLDGVTMIPLKGGDTISKPSKLKSTDRMSTDQYLKIVNEAGGDDDSGLKNFVDEALKNPEGLVFNQSDSNWATLPDDVDVTN